MACYISSQENRHYAVKETSFGTAVAPVAGDRVPVTRFEATLETVRPKRIDKTGSRSFTGFPANLRRRAAYRLTTYLASWPGNVAEPYHGTLMECAMGGAAQAFAGGLVDSIPSPSQVRFVDPHGLGVGQGVGFGGELRFVTGVVDPYTVEVNIPFTIMPSAGSPIGRTMSYSLARDLSSAAIFDYWSPDSALQRICSGAAVDRMSINLNGDYHVIDFRGPAADIVDNASFVPGDAGLSTFPIEPPSVALGVTPVAGHLGQVWLGAVPERFYTVVDAQFTLENNIDLRAREFGSLVPRCIVPGPRSASMQVSVYEQDNALTLGLVQAARSRSPIQVMFQLGFEPGQLMAVYLKSVVPEAPVVDDRESRVRLNFEDCLAQGVADDEVYIAFGYVMTDYRSTEIHESSAVPGVSLEIRRISFASRLELLRLLGQRVDQIAFLQAGESDAGRLEAAILERDIEIALVKWGLAGVHGLMLDGEPASVAALVERGPEALVREAVQLIVRQLGLSSEERKN